MTTRSGRLSGAQIDDLRFLFSNHLGEMGVRSSMGAQMDGAALYVGSAAPESGLRCGPVYCKKPTHTRTHYELGEHQFYAARRLARLRRVAAEVCSDSLHILRAVFVERRPPGLRAFGAVAPLIAMGCPGTAAVVVAQWATAEHGKHEAGAWVVLLSDRVMRARGRGDKPGREDALAVAEIRRAASDELGRAECEWGEADRSVRRG